MSEAMGWVLVAAIASFTICFGIVANAVSVAYSEWLKTKKTEGEKKVKQRELTALIANSVQNLRRKYIRNKHGELRGLMISFTRGDKTFVGTSFCHSHLDKFDKGEALFRALRNSVELDEKYAKGFEVRSATSFLPEVQNFWDRAMSFKNKVK